MTENTEELQQEYLRQLQEQVLSILNGVKDELGVDTPVDIEVVEASDE